MRLNPPSWQKSGGKEGRERMYERLAPPILYGAYLYVVESRVLRRFCGAEHRCWALLRVRVSYALLLEKAERNNRRGLGTRERM